MADTVDLDLELEEPAHEVRAEVGARFTLERWFLRDGHRCSAHASGIDVGERLAGGAHLQIAREPPAWVVPPVRERLIDLVPLRLRLALMQGPSSRRWCAA